MWCTVQAAVGGWLDVGSHLPVVIAMRAFDVAGRQDGQSHPNDYRYKWA